MDRVRVRARTVRVFGTLTSCFPGRLSDDAGSRLALAVAMAAPSHSVERLWSMGDGTICVLVERQDAPRFEICVLRGDEVLRQNRLYARGSAQMLADTWRNTLSAAPARLAPTIG
jgi:hypothetical protein